MRHLELWHRWRCRKIIAAAWGLLHERYEDSDERVMHHLKGIFNLSAMPTDLAPALRRLLDDFSTHEIDEGTGQTLEPYIHLFLGDKTTPVSG